MASPFQDVLSSYFKFLVDREGFSQSIRKDINTLFTLYYTKDNIKIVFVEDERDNDFTMEAQITSSYKLHRIRDDVKHWPTTNFADDHVVYNDIFDFTDDFMTKSEFNKKRMLQLSLSGKL